MCNVSIIVPVYNIETYLRECVDSLIKQTYKKVEIILVDDGSEDTSGKICDEYKEKDSRVQVYHIKNGGPAKARNYGLKKANGDYVMFVDADDWIEDVTIQNCVKQIERNDSDLVLFNMCDFKKNEKKEYHLLNGEVRHFDGQEIEYIEDMLLTFRAENIVDTTSLRGPVCKLYKRKIANECFFPEEMTLGEDTCFVQQFFRKMNSIVYLDKVFYHRRVLDSSLSHAYGLDYIEKRLEYVNWTLKFYSENKDYTLLNEFCFRNYDSVVGRIFNTNDISLRKKKRLIRKFLKGLEFKYNFSELELEWDNKNVRLIKKLLQHEMLTVAYIGLKMSKIKNSILNKNS